MPKTKVNKQYIINTRLRNPCALAKDIAAKYGISGERVRQILNQAKLPTNTRYSYVQKRNCIQCGVQLHYQNKKFCSRNCMIEYNHPLLECKNCHKLFRLKPPISNLIHRLNNAHVENGKPQKDIFCSRKCHGAHVGNSYGFAAHPENMFYS